MKTMIIDNFLPNADWLVNYSTSLEFRRRGEGEYFEGERSGELHAERKQMAGSICRGIIEEYYGIKDFNYNADVQDILEEHQKKMELYEPSQRYRCII